MVNLGKYTLCFGEYCVFWWAVTIFWDDEETDAKCVQQRSPISWKFSIGKTRRSWNERNTRLPPPL